MIDTIVDINHDNEIDFAQAPANGIVAAHLPRLGTQSQRTGYDAPASGGFHPPGER